MRLAALFHHTPRVSKCLGALALTLAITTTQAQSQFTSPPKDAVVTGTVTDTTNTGIPEATVSLKATEGFTLETRTDKYGRFAMDAWSGEYALNISAQGFRTLSEPVSLAEKTNLTKHVVLSVGSGCINPSCLTIEAPTVELEMPSPLTATLPLKPLPPYQLSARTLKRLQK